MKPVELLQSQYPEAPVIETHVPINQEDYDAQVAKNERRQAEGGAIGAVFMENGEVVLVNRSGMHAGWALPGGTVERGELFDEAFLREIEEETSVKARDVKLVLLERRIFESPQGESHTMDLAFFRATAELGQTAMTTELAKEEGLEVATFALDALPDMIFKDKERLLKAAQNRS